MTANHHLDLDRWRQLREAAANAADDGPTLLQLQDADGRAEQERNQLARFKAAGSKGHASGPPVGRRARTGETIYPGIGGHQPADVVRMYETDLRELEQRVEAAEAAALRLRERSAVCAQRRNALNRLMADIRAWAAAQTPPVLLPGDTPARPQVAIVANMPPPGTPDFSGRSA